MIKDDPNLKNEPIFAVSILVMDTAKYLLNGKVLIWSKEE
jgi:hypothetical protein